MAQNTIYWKFDTNTLYIRGEDVTGYTVWNIPSSYNSFNIPWYSNRGSITSVVIETIIDVTTIANWFYRCETLVSITNFNYITNVTDMKYCFANCEDFNQSITIPSSVTNMYHCFEKCYSFNSQVIFQSPSSVTNMSGCLSDCDVFNQPITIPSSVTNMYQCFYRDENFNSQVTFQSPSSVTNMSYCFYNCKVFNQPITIPSSVTDMNNCFSGCYAFNQSITIPSSVTTVAQCFDNCSVLNSQVTFQSPSSVTNMSVCFRGCFRFNQSITIPNSVTNMRNCFDGCSDFNQSITIPNSVTDMNNCFRSCSSFNKPIAIPSSVTDMSYCFYNCTALNNNVVCFNYPTSYGNIFSSTTKQITVTLIGDTACDHYSDWITIIHNYSNVGFGPPTFNVQFELGDYRYTYMYSSGEISFNIKVIDKTKTTYSAIDSAVKMNNEYRYVTNMKDCFYGCTAFNQSITIPSSITNMRYCFYGCTSFNQLITIPSSVTDMGGCFYNCTSFNQPITIPSSVNKMYSCFEGCTSFDQPITIPSSITNMNSCFYECTSFNQPITIPSSVTSMEYCFYRCTSFNSQVTFQAPSSVTDMYYCFKNCTSFNQAITIPSSVTIMNYCFQGCTNFNQSIEIPSSVTGMGGCFYGCTSFNQAIIIPNSVTDMRVCFQGCTSLNSLITINSNASSIYNDIFRETSRVIPITGTFNKLQNIASSYDNVYVYSLQCTNIVAERDDDTPTNVELEIVVSRFIADGGEINIDVYTDNIPVDNLVWNPSSLIMDNLTKKFTTTLIVDESSSHEISVQIRDVWGESSVRTISVSTVYYTIDFLHGGKGVSFGEKAIADDMYFPLQGVTPFEADKYYSRGVLSSGEHKFDKIHTKPDKWDEEPENYYALENPGGLFKNDMNSLFKRKLDLYEDGSPDGEERGYVDSVLTEMLETRGWNDCISYVDGSGMISTLHVREILKNLLDMSLVGEIKAYAGTNIPRGWLDCDGRLVNISDYPYLFSVLGNTWGTPTATQFYLPDLRGRTLIGSQSGTYNVGGTGGSPYIQAHTHGFTNPTIPNHTHTLTGNWSDGTGSASAYTYHTGRKAATRATRNDGGGGQTSGGAVGGVNNVSTGTSGNYPPYKVVRYIIKY